MSKKNNNYKTIMIKSNKEEYKIILDDEDFEYTKNMDLLIVKQHGYASVNAYLNKVKRQRRSLGKILLNTDRNVYFKNRYTNKDKFLLDYRKENLTISIKEMEGYVELARNNYFENKDVILNNRHKKRTYTVDLANKFMVGKVGEDNYSSKLTEKEVQEIRNAYSKGGITQENLAIKYGVSRSTISSIITYKRWTDALNKSKRIFRETNIETIIERSPLKKELLAIEQIELNKTYFLKSENLYYYLEDINNDGLVYMEVRDKNKDILVRGDLFFTNEVNKQTKREYSVACKYPARTPVSIIVSYVDKLKEYI